MRSFIFLILICLTVNCGSGLEMVTNKSTSGKIKEQYTINPKTKEKEGLYKSFDSEGAIIEEATYKANLLNGERRIYYENGNVQSLETFVAGEHQGRYLSFYDSGKIELQGDYLDGKMEGEWKAYYPNGQLKEIVQFRINNENGAFIEYYEHGKLKAECNYLDGDNEDGLLKLYDEKGELERKMKCEKGVCRTIWSKTPSTEEE